jgi:rubrerythrin
MTPIEILRLAIRREEEACDYYRQAYEKIEEPSTKEVLKELMAEEVRHKARLEKELYDNFYTEM